MQGKQHQLRVHICQKLHISLLRTFHAVNFRKQVVILYKGKYLLQGSVRIFPHILGIGKIKASVFCHGCPVFRPDAFYILRHGLPVRHPLHNRIFSGIQAVPADILSFFPLQDSVNHPRHRHLVCRLHVRIITVQTQVIVIRQIKSSFPVRIFIGFRLYTQSFLFVGKFPRNPLDFLSVYFSQIGFFLPVHHLVHSSVKSSEGRGMGCYPVRLPFVKDGISLLIKESPVFLLPVIDLQVTIQSAIVCIQHPGKIGYIVFCQKSPFPVTEFSCFKGQKILRLKEAFFFHRIINTQILRVCSLLGITAASVFFPSAARKQQTRCRKQENRYFKIAFHPFHFRSPMIRFFCANGFENVTFRIRLYHLLHVSNYCTLWDTSDCV